MSNEKNRAEALRWLRTADDDLDTAVILKDNKKFAHACFHAQQAAEKALKALWINADAEPWGHSIQKLIEDLQTVDLELFEVFKGLSRLGNLLDRFYIPTRCPNGLPDLTPDVVFEEEDAQTCIQSARKIVDEVHQRFKSR